MGTNVHGMTLSMLQIVKMESKRRAEGIKSYGYYEHENHIPGVKKAVLKICQHCFELFRTYDKDAEICPKCLKGSNEDGYYLACNCCGKIVHRQYKRKIVVCKECKQKRKRQNRKTDALGEPNLLLHCTSCGKEILRRRAVQNPKCEECKNAHRRDLMKAKSKEYGRRKRDKERLSSKIS